jgi:hypothetical protein
MQLGMVNFEFSMHGGTGEPQTRLDAVHANQHAHDARAS